MLLISVSLALLVVYAGLILLIRTKKESLGNFYRFSSWFFILAGFLTLGCTGVYSVAKVCKYGGKMMMSKKEYKMGKYHKMDKYHNKMQYMHGCGMKGYHSGMRNEDCAAMMNCCKCPDAVCKPDSVVMRMR